MADIKKLLAAASKKHGWAKAKETAAAKSGDFQEINDGIYTARLLKAEIGESKAGRLQIDFAWKILDGEGPAENFIKHDYQGLDSENNLIYMGRRITDFGYEMPDDLSELPAILEAIVAEKPMARIKVQTRGDFQNVYIQKMLTEDEDEDATEDEDEVDETEETEETEEETEETEEETEEEDAEEGAEDEGPEEGEEVEEEEEEGEEEEVTIEVGMKVIAETAKGREPGEIVEIIEKDNKVRVKLDKDDKVIRISAEKIELPDEEEVPEEPKAKKAAPAAKTAPADKAAPAKAAPVKKAAPAPVKKAAPVKAAAKPVAKKKR